MHTHPHAIVWMDSHEAHIILLDATSVEENVVRSQLPFRKLHHKAGAIGSGHQHLPHEYLEAIAESLKSAHAWLLTGPAGAKEQMAAFVHTQKPDLSSTLAAVEHSDHPTEAQLVAHARRYFEALRKMRGNTPDRHAVT